MRISSLYLKNFRNLSEQTFEPVENVNIICGKNAQGKTNLLEAMWLFTGGRSFRGIRDEELIAFGEKASRLEMDFFSGERDQKAVIKLSGKRENELNGVPLRATSEIIGSFCGVIFSPSHLSLVKDGPQIRRKFIDAAICQLRPSYTAKIARFNRIMRHRNSLLHLVSVRSASEKQLDVWDHEFASASSELVFERNRYTGVLYAAAAEIYDGISSSTEKFEIEYLSQYFEDGMKKEEYAAVLEEKLIHKRQSDVKNLYTSSGPHRDDLELKINGKNARIFASQGQQRSCVLSLKLSEAVILNECIEEAPVIFLDDVMSELDETRQAYVLNSLKDCQVFITCCDSAPLMRLDGGAVFKMKSGELSGKEVF